MPRFTGEILMGARRGVQESNDRFQEGQDRRRSQARQDKQDAYVDEERAYARGRRAVVDPREDRRAERDDQRAANEDRIKELEQNGLKAMQAAFGGDFTAADALATEILGSPVQTRALPDGKVELTVNGKTVVANSVEEWAMGNPRKGKRAGFATIISPRALENYLSRVSQVQDQEAGYEREDFRDQRQYGRQVALQDRSERMANERLRFGAPQMITQGDGSVLERRPGESVFRPAMVDDGTRPPPPGLAPEGEEWQPGSAPRFGPQPAGGPRPLKVAPGTGIGRGGGAGNGNPFGNSAKAQEAWMNVRAMASADKTGTLAAMLQQDPYAVLALQNELAQNKGDQAMRYKTAVTFMSNAQRTALPGVALDPASMQAGVQGLLDSVDQLSMGGMMGGAGAGDPMTNLPPPQPSGGMGTPGVSPYPEGKRLQGPDGRTYVVTNGKPVPVGG